MTQERNREERPIGPTAGGGVPNARGHLRDEAERLLAVSADVIERALSEDSASFLAANKQAGGE